jgi:hypothetical protein
LYIYTNAIVVLLESIFIKYEVFNHTAKPS